MLSRLYSATFLIWTSLLAMLLHPGRIGYTIMIKFPIWLYYRLFFGTSDKRVVIVGGGFAGTEIAKVLQSFVNVDLIDTKEYFEFTPSILRAAVDPQKVAHIQVPFKDCLKGTSTHVGTVTTINEEKKSVTYTEKSSDRDVTLPFDYLVIASGATCRTFDNPNIISSTKAADFIAARDKLEGSNRVIVIGGGYVGVELAAEIVTTYPDKKVTVVHSGSTLLSRGSKSASTHTLDFFQKNNVPVILGERIDFDKTTREEGHPVHMTTHSGMTIDGDLVFVCIGIKPSTSFIRDENLENGFVINNPFLKTSLGEYIFTCGDVASIDEEKLAQSAQRGAAVVAHNLLCKIHGKSEKVRTYAPTSLPIIISLGKYDAIFTWGPVTLRGFWASLMKEVVEWKVLISY